jgi:D-3-phosphoglycerate dehydrogenase
VREALVTDFAWKDLEIEEDILSQAGAKLVVANSASEAELLRLAPTADGILTCWMQVSGNEATIRSTRLRPSSTNAV